MSLARIAWQNSCLVVITLPAFTRLSAFLFMPPPTPSQGPFLWPPSNQVHEALRPNSDGNFATRAHIVRFRYCKVGESVSRRFWKEFLDFLHQRFDESKRCRHTVISDTCNPHVALVTKLEVYHHWVYGHLELVIEHCRYFLIASAHPIFSIVHLDCCLRLFRHGLLQDADLVILGGDPVTVINHLLDIHV